MLYQKANIMNSVPLFRSILLRNFQCDLQRRNIGNRAKSTVLVPPTG